MKQVEKCFEKKKGLSDMQKKNLKKKRKERKEKETSYVYSNIQGTTKS